MSQVFLLGANDSEMHRIEEILRENGQQVEYAQKDGKRCHPGNAYQADDVDFSLSNLILVECCPLSLDPKIVDGDLVRIDHHRPGDPGYGLPASDFWQASSLGQVYKFLGLGNPSHDDLVLTAMDHNPAGAIRGECPGVSAQDVIDRKVSEISTSTKASPDEVRAHIGLRRHLY